MHLPLFKKHVPLSVSSLRRRAGGLGMAALLLLAGPAMAVSYTVDIQSSPANYGSVTGYYAGFGVSLSNGVNVINDPQNLPYVELAVFATASNSAIFSSWGGSLAAELDNTNSPATILRLDQSGTLVCNFDTRVLLNVSPNPAAYGSTTPSGGTNVAKFKSFPVKAVPNMGYEFTRWVITQGSPVIGGTNDAETTVIPNSNVAGINALFQTMPRLTVTAPLDGSIYLESSFTNDTVAAGSTKTYFAPTNGSVTVTAIAGVDKEFVNWTPLTGGAVDPSNITTTVTMNKSKSLSVQFQAKQVRYTLITDVNRSDWGTVTPFGTNSYIKDSFIDITATPSNDYAFLKWTKINGGPVQPGYTYQNPLVNIQMSQDRDFKALFTNKFTVTVTDRNGPGSGDQTYDVVAGEAWSNAPTTVVGNDLIRYRLYGWTDGTGNINPTSGVGQVVQITKVTQNSTFKWTWVMQYRLTHSVSGPGTPDPSAVDVWKDANSAVTVTPIKSTDPLSTLAGWIVNGIALNDRTDSLSFTMDGPKDVVAIFKEVSNDTDNDGLPSWWEQQFGLDPISTNNPQDGAQGDPDRDGLSNLQEYLMSTTNSPDKRLHLMNPLSWDSDADGIEDYFEAYYMSPSNLTAGDVFISPATDDKGVNGRNGNPDGDYWWDTETGYEMLTQPLNNYDEWVGPDRIVPCTNELIVWSSAYPVDSTRTTTVINRRDPAYPADLGTQDSSDPRMADTDADTFDDGFEFSWDIWQRTHCTTNYGFSTNIVKNTNSWPTITNSVPDWNTQRRYNPQVALKITPLTMDPDYDMLYNILNGNATDAYTDENEYNASTLSGTFTSNFIPVPRVAVLPSRWCTNPFMWDTDGDGLPDGWEMTFGYDPWNTDTDRDRIQDGAENPDGEAYAVVALPVNRGYLSVESNVTVYLTNMVADISTNGFGDVETNYVEVVTTTNLAAVTNFVYYMGKQVVTNQVDIEVVVTNEYGDVLTNLVTTNSVVTNTVPATFSQNFIHKKVYDHVGFNPFTAWISGKAMQLSQSMSNIVEFAGMLGLPSTLTDVAGVNSNLWGNYDSNGMPYSVDLTVFPGASVDGTGSVFMVPAMLLYKGFPGDDGALSTGPRNMDSDGDGVWDGWEYYMGLNPVDSLDVSEDPDKDGLSFWQEFIGLNIIAYWKSVIQAGGTPDAIQPMWEAFAQSWPNKSVTTDPYDNDTDGDQIFDGDEQGSFNYAGGNSNIVAAVPTGMTMMEGGGLNPDSVDSDKDYLPDFWEYYWPGVNTSTNGTNQWSGGMNGTVSDYLEDYDGDGLYNYQEYLVAACYQFQYLFNNGSDSVAYGEGKGACDPYDFFDIAQSGGDPMTGPGALAARAEWDPAYWADYYHETPYIRYSFISVPSFDKMTYRHSSSCNPGDVDTDHDGYDDFYELYHGLNPIRGIMDRCEGKTMGMAEIAFLNTYLAPLTYGQPFRWGERPLGPVADYDQDGQVDVEENITANLPAVQAYLHTDPSPYFVTDISSVDSYVNRFYATHATFGTGYWFWDRLVMDGWRRASAYLFTFEVNEGYDTDNDLVSDSVEVSGSTPGATDPLDDDSPLRQRALYVNGVDAAARLFGPEALDWHAFRAWTVEAWIRPLSINGDRVILERAGMVSSGNPSVPDESRVTRNFRLGIKDGVPYVTYDGYGVNPANSVTNWYRESVNASSRFKVNVDVWTHLAAVYNASRKQLYVYVNGELAGSAPTASIPFNGYIAGNPLNGDLEGYHMSVVVGAADNNPEGYCDGTRNDIKSGEPNWLGQYPLSYPDLDNYFHGWIDEVHLWNGILSADQIRALKDQKMTRSLINEINGVQTGNQTFLGGMGGDELNPKMVYAFTFDGLQEPANGVVPLGFELTTAPSAYSMIPWWGLFPYHSTVYNDYRYVKWIQNMASHQPYEPPRDTHTVFMFNADGTTNIFPNTSNPYTFEYVHGRGGSTEYHPQYSDLQVSSSGMAPKDFPREFSGVYGDLLPLGAAAADSSITMWDGSTPSDENRDQDKDGLPDLWEEANQLDPHNPLDAADDPDRDGMSTRLEYTIGSNPFGAFSLSQNIWDFFAYTNGVAGPFRFIGEEYTDMDYMDDLWEAAYRMNTEMYDAVGPDADPDNDGWSNLAEFQELANLRGSGGSNNFQRVDTSVIPAYTPLASNEYYLSLLGDLSFLQNQGTNTNSVTWSLAWNDPMDERFHPIPEMIFRFQYAGKNRTSTAPRFVVQAYSDRGMDVPDASIRGTGDRAVGWPRYMTLNNGSANSFSFEGSIREGQNYFWGFMDLNNDAVYQDNEPGGYSGPVNVRWGTVGPVDIPLTDKRPMGFARFSWDDALTGGGAGGASTNRIDPTKVENYYVTIVDKNVANSPIVFSRTYDAFRTFTMEADLMAVKKINKGFKRPGGYQYYVRAEYDNKIYDVKTGMIYEKYTTPLPAPTLVWPLANNRLRQSRDTFIWKMDPSVTWCTITVKRRDTGQTMMTHSFPPPARDIYGRSKMQMPIYIGDGVMQNGVYDYTLTVQNPVASATATAQFTIRIGDYPGYSYSLSGQFVYPGKVTSGNFVIEAFNTPGFGGTPAGRRVVTNTITSAGWPTNAFDFTIRGLPDGWYYVRGFLDQNDAYPHYKADDFESQGWYTRNFYWAEPVHVTGNETVKLGEWVKILMRDLDNDRLPDDWEYRWTGNLDSYGLGDLRGYTPALNGILNVFECYGGAALGLSPK